MNVHEYMDVVKDTDQLEPKSPTDPNYKVMPILGLAGEIGSLLAELKKRVREPERSAHVSRARIKEELGDIMWYAVTIGRRAELDFVADILFANLVRISKDAGLYLPLLSGAEEPGKELIDAVESKDFGLVQTFESYRSHAAKSSRLSRNQQLVPYLARIWQNSGELLSKVDLKACKFEGAEKKIVAKVLGDVMWYVAGFATLHDLNLDVVAHENAQKAESMFMPKVRRKRSPLRDDRCKPHEQFPRKFDVDFVSVDANTAIMMINGLQIGDRVQDNAYQFAEGVIDGYRFHDCIHLAFVAVLGWSPVIRGLMKRKRKSDASIDNVEDGARAQIVEEMIVKLTHTYAVNTDSKALLEGQKHISMDLLKQIESLAVGLEVTGSYEKTEPCKLWEWEEAILSGYKVFNDLRRCKGGRVRIDLKKRAISFTEIDPHKAAFFPLLT